MNKPSPILDAFPATPLQLGMLYHGLVAPDSAVFLQHYSMVVTGPLDVDAFAEAWRRVAGRHASLCSSFHWQGLDQCLQVVSRAAKLPVHREDWRADAPASHEARLSRLVAADRQVPFNLERPPLARLLIVKLANERHFVIIALHHVIADGWSLNVAMDEVAALYAEAALGRPANLPPAPSFRSYAAWLRKLDMRSAQAFWQDRLATAVPCRLPMRRSMQSQNDATDKDRPEDLAYGTSRLDAADTATMLQAAREMGITSATLVQGAWALVLARYERQDRVLFGVSTASRPASIPGIDRIFGPLMAVLPCNVEIDDRLSVRDWLAAMQRDQLTAREFDYLSPADHQQLAGLSPRDEFLNTMLIVEDMPAARSSVWDDLGIGFTLYDAYERTAYPLNMFVFPGDSYLFRLNYDRRQFSPDAIDQLLAQMTNLCRQLAGKADRPLSEVCLSEGDARSAKLCGPSELGGFETVWGLVEDGLRGLSSALEGEADGTLASGPALLERAAALDARLGAAGVVDGQPVAVLLDPGVDYAAAVLACLRRASPYALLDPLLPAAAVAERLAAAGLTALIAPPDRLDALAEARGPAGVAGRDNRFVGLAPDAPADAPAGDHPPPPPRPAADPDQPLLMVWTSGSTGSPKTPVLTQRGLRNRLLWDRTAFPREPRPRALLKTSPAFVDSVAELLQPFVDGFPAVVPDPDDARAPSALLRLLHTAGPTRLVLTPSLLRALLDAADDAEGAAEHDRDTDDAPTGTPWPLYRLHLSGEPLAADLLPRLRPRLRPDAVVLNLYGAAEVTADVTAETLDLNPGDLRPGAHRLAIGTPLPGCQVWLLDPDRRPVPPGAVGEMHIAGAALAAGYHRAPALTDRAFFPWTDPDGRPLRLYATGDLARLTDDHRLLPLGRKDAQIKRHGVRIEPAEIEARLLDLPDIRAALVTTVPRQSDDRHTQAPALVAYLEPASTAPDDDARQDHWRRVYDQSYQTLADDAGTARHILDDFRIWRSAVDGAAIPADHMRAWVDHICSLVRERPADRLVEVGCGQGLLLGRLAPEHPIYLGTDISDQALACVDRLRQADTALAHVRTLRQPADRPIPHPLIPDGGFDVALLSSVVQYFPGPDYLLRTLCALLPAMATGGRLILADLRGRHLAPLLAADILRHRADDALDPAALRRRRDQLLAQEPELLVDPRYFAALGRRLPRLAAVDARPRPGPQLNELTRYRYDIVLHLDHPPAADTPATPATAWAGRNALNAALARKPAALRVRAIPQQRLAGAARAHALLDDPDLQDAADWRRRIDQDQNPPTGDPDRAGLDPAELTALAEAAGYRALVRLDLNGDPGQLDLLCRPADRTSPDPAALAVTPTDRDPHPDWIANPYDAAAAGDLTQRAKHHLRLTLPPAFIPDHLITVQHWPKSNSQKILTHKLPKPDFDKRSRPFIEPIGQTEKQLAELWCKVLGKADIGRDDDFFESSGNSLLLTQLSFSIGKSFGIKFPLRTAFAAPTLADMARHIDAIIAGDGAAPDDGHATVIAGDTRLGDTITANSGPRPDMWPRTPATVFHSGPGGFLAHWILRRLLSDPALTVIYLGAGRDTAESQRIIAQEWAALGLGQPGALERLEILPGALDQPRLGLSPDVWDDLAERADVLFHAGIRLNMAEPYGQLRAANVLGTREMLRLSMHRRPKPLHAVGSYAIIDHGVADRDGLSVGEDTKLTAFQGLESDYRKTRWVSETMMRRAAGRGLPVSIHRITPLCGDSVGGLIDPGEITWRLARAMIVTGGVPESRRPLDLLPIDVGVDAMIALARDPDNRPGVTHIIGDRSMTWADMGHALRALGHDIAIMPPAAWYDRLRTWVESHPEDTSLGGLWPLINQNAEDHRHFFAVDGARTRDRLSVLGIDLAPAGIADLIRTLRYLTDRRSLPEPSTKGA